MSLFDDVASRFITFQTPVEEPEVDPVEQAQADLLAGLAGSLADLIGDEGSTDEASFRSDNPAGWSATVDAFTQLYKSNVYSRTSIGHDVERFANDYYAQNGSWPTVSELFHDQTITNYMGGASSGLNAVMPLTFVVDDTLYLNDPYLGVVPGYEDPKSIPEGTGTGRLFNAPVFTPEDVAARIGMVTPPTGGGGAAPATFDLAQLEERYRSMYRSALLEDPGEVRDLMRKYQNEYRAFAKAGGRLDFDTWADRQIDATPRAKLLYAKKPEFMDKSQYMRQYSDAAFSVGLTADRAKEETEAGLMSGGSAAGFAERVSRTQGVDTGGAGFGRRLANLTNQMGVART